MQYKVLFFYNFNINCPFDLISTVHLNLSYCQIINQIKIGFYNFEFCSYVILEKSINQSEMGFRIHISIIFSKRKNL